MNEIQAFQAQRQQRRDLGFLVALGLLLAASAYAVLRSAYPPHRGHVTASGEIRAVDPSTLQRQLRSGRLSHHEAEHWRRGGTPATAPGARTPRRPPGGSR